jgi:hypothetical protein
MTDEERQELIATLQWYGDRMERDLSSPMRAAADEIERLAALVQSNANLDAVVTTCPKCGKPVTSYWHKDNSGCESRPEYGLIA